MDNPVNIDHIAQAVLHHQRFEALIDSLMNPASDQPAQYVPWYRVGQRQRGPVTMEHRNLEDLVAICRFGIPVWLAEAAADTLQLKLGCGRDEAYSRLVYNLTMMQYRVPGGGYPLKCDGK